MSDSKDLSFYDRGLSDLQVNEWMFMLADYPGQGISSGFESETGEYPKHPLEIDPVSDKELAMDEAVAHCVAAIGPPAEIFAPFIYKQYCMDNVNGVRLYQYPSAQKAPGVELKEEPFKTSVLIDTLDKLVSAAGIKEDSVGVDTRIPITRSFNFPGCRKYAPSPEPSVYFMEPPPDGIAHNAHFVHFYADGPDGKGDPHKVTALLAPLHAPHPLFSRLSELGYRAVHVASMTTTFKVGLDHAAGSIYRLVAAKRIGIGANSLTSIKGLTPLNLPWAFQHECICGVTQRGYCDYGGNMFAFDTGSNFMSPFRSTTNCVCGNVAASALPAKLSGYTLQFGAPSPVYRRQHVYNLNAVMKMLFRNPPWAPAKAVPPFSRARKRKEVVEYKPTNQWPKLELHDEDSNFLEFDIGSDMAD